MSRISWPVVVALLLTGLIAFTLPGQMRGSAYGRYVAAQALIERRATVLDGSVDGVRARVGAPLDEAAYFGGHYFLTEPPLLTWLAGPLYAGVGYASNAVLGALFVLGMGLIVWYRIPEPR